MYRGQITHVPLGQTGVYTDDSQTITPPQGVIRAENVEIKNGFIEKATGSRRWNSAALPSGVAAFFDWWPSEGIQRTIVVTKDGRVWRFTDPNTVAEVLPTGTAPTLLKVTIPPVLLSCGNEESNNPRKLFIMTGNDPIQVITADGITRSDIALPALDWSLNNQPYFAIVFLNRLWAFGNQNFPHLLYASSVTDHEDFQTLGDVLQANVFPGESERLITASTYKGRLMCFKYPFGYYFIDTTDPTAPIPQKLGDSFGASSQQSTLQVIDDLWIGNSTGTISSLSATNALGGLQQDDVVKDMKCYRYLAENTSPRNNSDQRALWYEAKKLVYLTYHSPSGMLTDRIFVIDFQSGSPRPSLDTKDQPNCMGLVKDYRLVQRPFYGAEDGYLYEMDHADRSVGGNGVNNANGDAYEMLVQTPYLDFGFIDPRYAETTKNFDFLELTFEPTGRWSVSADIFVDNNFVETRTFDLSQSDVLDKNFKLDKSRLSGPGLRSSRIPIHGHGRRISVVLRQDGLKQNVKINGLTYYYRLAGQQQRSA